ncbi:3520_t:CDS:2, partial [Racocetra fulgida]
MLDRNEENAIIIVELNKIVKHITVTILYNENDIDESSSIVIREILYKYQGHWKLRNIVYSYQHPSEFAVLEEPLINSWTSDNINLSLISRYHHLINIQFDEILAAPTITKCKEIAAEYGLRIKSPILDELKRERHLQSPHDIYHVT